MIDRLPTIPTNMVYSFSSRAKHTTPAYSQALRLVREDDQIYQVEIVNCMPTIKSFLIRHFSCKRLNQV